MSPFEPTNLIGKALIFISDSEVYHLSTFKQVVGGDTGRTKLKQGYVRGNVMVVGNARLLALPPPA